MHILLLLAYIGGYLVLVNSKLPGGHRLSAIRLLGDPDIFRNVSELISSKGYPVEEHSVETEDGYVLSLQRIPYGAEGQEVGPPVLLMHGILDCADTYVVNFPQQSLGFILADAGFDVWLGNSRGNKYSKIHANYTTDMPDFWNFSFDELAQYDLPAMIDYILNVTEQEQLYYIGHSQGSTMAFALLADNPDYNPKIKLIVALAPVVYIHHLAVELRSLLETGVNQHNSKGPHDLLPEGHPLIRVAKLWCSSVLKTSCVKFVLRTQLFSDFFNKTRVAVHAYHYPDSASSKSLVHFAQLLKSKTFSKYDYGEEENLSRYNQSAPPVYNISSITTPVALMWSSGDRISHPRDVALLRRELQNVVEDYHVPIGAFRHGDFLIGCNSREILYDEILRLFALF